MLPSGAAGKNYTEEVTRLIKLWINDTPLKEIVLKAVNIIMLLLKEDLSYRRKRGLRTEMKTEAARRRTYYTGKIEVIQ